MWNSVMEFIIHSVGLQKSWLKRFSDRRERSEPLLLKARLYAAAACNFETYDSRRCQVVPDLSAETTHIGRYLFPRMSVALTRSCYNSDVCHLRWKKKKISTGWLAPCTGSRHLRSMTIMHWCQYFIHFYINSFLFIFKQYWNPGADFPWVRTHLPVAIGFFRQHYVKALWKGGLNSIQFCSIQYVFIDACVGALPSRQELTALVRR